MGAPQLVSIVKEEQLVAGGVASWHGKSACVAEDGNNADFVYQSLLVAGGVVQWPDGRTLSIESAQLQEWIARLPPEFGSGSTPKTTAGRPH